MQPVSDKSLGYDLLPDVWVELCGYLDAPELDWEQRFAAIAARIADITTEELPEHLKCPIAECYRRTVVGARHTLNRPGFEVVLSHWRSGCITPIHGHPPVVFYGALTGAFEMDLYERHDDWVRPTGETRAIAAGEYLFSAGAGGGYDHFIHTVRCVDEGWTLNLYSDNALKGVKFIR
jgi:hypothetical protein